jgi:multimeric flavodoxin WrbA
MCGACFELGRCARDDAFNEIYTHLSASDGIFLVCPHYAPIPSKVMMLLEKLEQMLFLKSCAEPSYRSPLFNKPVGIIAHGGQTEQARPYYKTALLDPLAAALSSVQMQVIGAGEEWPNGVTFGITRLSKPADSIFVSIEHDWEAVRQHILPLVENVASAVVRAAAH